MPEQSLENPKVEKVLESLEDHTISTYKSRCSNYQRMQCALENQHDVNEDVVHRLLAVCIQDLKEDMKYAVHTLNVISVVVKKVKNEWNFNVDLTSSVMAILNLLKSATLINKVQNLQNLCFEVLITFPDKTFRELGSKSKYSREIIDIFNLYFNQNVPIQVRLMPFDILFKLLETLPPEKRSNFVKEGLNTWFSKVIPTVMSMVVTSNPMVPKMINVLEMLTDELVHIEYSQNVPWLNILDSISANQKYPGVLKTLLDSGSPIWSNLWIVFVKLAKQQITSIRQKNGSAINSMLPVVEHAFKIDTENRLRAFDCWNVLIDNFAESSDSVKRIKLLIIPLKSNNAKVEETALAKFNTWWNFIRKFCSRSENIESIVLPFLNFCFGNVNSTSERNASTPGLRYPKLTVLCAQAFAEICGHINCPGCVPDTLAPLQQGLLTSVLLTKHFSDWLFTLKTFLRVMGVQSCEYERKKDQIQCVWSSVILVMAADVAQERRSNMIGELLNVLRELVQETKDNGMAEVTLNLCLRNLLEHQHIKRELYTKADVGRQTSHLHKVLRLALHPQVQKHYNRFDDETLEQLKPITNIITDPSFCSPNHIIEWLLMELTPNDPSLMFWTALLKSVITSNDVSPKKNMDIMLWPLKHLTEFSNMQYAANVWNESYTKIKPKLTDSLRKEISVILLTDSRTTTDHLALYALLHTVKDVLNSNNDSDCKLEAELLMKLLSRVKTPGQVEAAMPSITDCLELMLTKGVEIKSEAFAEYTIQTTKTTLKFLLQLCKEEGKQKNHILLTERITKSLELFFKFDGFIKFKTFVVDHLIELIKFNYPNKNLKRLACDILEEILKKSKPTDMPFYSKVNDAILSMQVGENKIDHKAANPETAFTTPSTKTVTKKYKKKEANIVDTVVDNGEEFEVIKTHWKFNPRKLTEKQKEKLQRKREDIPALYQDLSQSQDEFKLSTWKADSQDTSTSNSKSESTTNATAEVTSALQNMASADVVPEIMKNIFSSSPKPNVKVAKAVTPKPKNSPRMALKERVYKNLEILCENYPTKKVEVPQEINKTITDINLIKTPKEKFEDLKTAAFSDPSKSDCHRPARAKRKPRKYDLDFAEIPLKKHNKNKHSFDSQNEENVMIAENQAKKNDIGTVTDHNTLNNEIKPLERKSPLNEHKEEINSTEKYSKQHIDLGEVINIQDKEESQKGVPDNLMETDNQVVPETLDTQDFVVSLPVKNKSTDNCQNLTNPSTPINNVFGEQSIKTSTKKSGSKSRIVNELAIDTVEGNPFFKSSEGRPKRKAVSRRRNLSQRVISDNIDNKLEVQTPKKAMSDEPKTKRFDNDLKKATVSVSIDDMMLSEDFIESSQDSTLTTISVRSTKSSTKKTTKSARRDGSALPNDNSQSLLDDTVDRFSREINNSKEDIEFSRNKSVNQTVEIKDTPELDTEPIDKSICFSEVIVINDDPEPIEVNILTDKISPESQELANADTQPVDPNNLQNEVGASISLNDVAETQLEITDIETALDATVPNKSEQSSPFKDQDQRNKDFLNDTLEISPIKTMSPVKDTSYVTNDSAEDYEVIVLHSPVQTNGEPFDKSSSPEIFTEDKVSPDKRDLSPPREVIAVAASASPNSLLTLKKNRPQMRAGNRAAQMLGLCAPDRLQSILNNCDRTEEESVPLKSNVMTPARRNLRIQYLANENNEAGNDGADENDNSENFLMFKRILPSANSSPTGPILKRKLAEIADESTLSPASKRKRVSFHDPPVSTTVAVQKYIEPLGVRSPQNISKKITRQQANMKSPKKLEIMFKLDTVLTRACESFGEITTVCDETEMSSLEPTLSVEVIRNEELNNTDPICSELISCQDSIAVIASDLSSPAMKTLFVKELAGKVETVGDLAKLTELEVNRLCIRAPKVIITRKVLNAYADKKRNDSQETGQFEQMVSAEVHCSALDKSDIEIQTESVSYNDVEMQTNEVSLSSTDTQTTAVGILDALVQTDESGSKTTKDIIRNCLDERKDFVEELNSCLDVNEKSTIAEGLSFTKLSHLMTSKLKTDSSDSIGLVKDFITKAFNTKDVILLCSELLQNVHDNTV